MKSTPSSATFTILTLRPANVCSRPRIAHAIEHVYGGCSSLPSSPFFYVGCLPFGSQWTPVSWTPSSLDKEALVYSQSGRILASLRTNVSVVLRHVSNRPHSARIQFILSSYLWGCSWSSSPPSCSVSGAAKVYSDLLVTDTLYSPFGQAHSKIPFVVHVTCVRVVVASVRTPFTSTSSSLIPLLIPSLLGVHRLWSLCRWARRNVIFLATSV